MVKGHLQKLPGNSADVKTDFGRKCAFGLQNRKKVHLITLLQEIPFLHVDEIFFCNRELEILCKWTLKRQKVKYVRRKAPMASNRLLFHLLQEIRVRSGGEMKILRC